jgi:hypothetical protein
MRASTAFLVGVGTVGLAITGGLGGGLLIGNMMSPSPPQRTAEAAPLEQPRSPPPMPGASALPYAAATLAFTDPSIDGRPPQADQQADNSTTSSPRPTVSGAAPANPRAKPSDSASARQPTQEAQQAPSAKQPSTPDDSYAKAGDSDLKHAADKRRAERAQRWADRHRHGRYRDAERGDSDDRAPPYYVDEPQRFGVPRVELFGPDD